MLSEEYRTRHPDRQAQLRPGPIVAITGLSGSGSRLIGAHIAPLIGARLIDDAVTTEMVRKRLGRSIGELDALVASYGSLGGRILRALLTPWERYGAYEIGYDGLSAWSYLEHFEPQHSLTKEQYMEGLRGVVTALSLEGNVVLHGHGSHLFIPPNIPAIRVFVAAPASARRQSAMIERGISARDAEEWLKQADRRTLALHRSLYGANLLDMSQYDIILSTERMSVEAAAHAVAGALEHASYAAHEQVAAPALAGVA